jgi:regulator of RNase E activity RraA
LVRPGDAIVGDDDGVIVVPRPKVNEVIKIAHEREEIEEIIKAQLEIENCSFGKYYPFNENIRKLYEEKTGRKRAQ